MNALTTYECPNCNAAVVDGKHADNGCVLHVLAETVKDRGETPAQRITELVRDCDPEALWQMLGPLVDDFEAGRFSYPDQVLA